VTVPWTGYQPNPNWVQWLQPSADHLFSAIAHDTKLPSSKKSGKGKHGKKGATPVTVTPAQVTVTVLNGTGTSHLAADTSNALAARGFKVGQPGDASTQTYTNSVVEYATAAELPQAQLLAKQIGSTSDVKLELDSQLSSTAPLQLILGSSFSTLQPLQPTPTSSATIQNIANTYGGITGSVDICHDQAAFAGPDGQ